MAGWAILHCFLLSVDLHESVLAGFAPQIVAVDLIAIVDYFPDSRVFSQLAKPIQFLGRPSHAPSFQRTKKTLNVPLTNCPMRSVHNLIL
jgi:hypothetical protein